MNLKEYFENTKGVGVLSTADSSGKVNAAIYGRPHFVDDATVASRKSLIKIFIDG
jgi:hypothetical protein